MLFENRYRIHQLSKTPEEVLVSLVIQWHNNSLELSDYEPSEPGFELIKYRLEETMETIKVVEVYVDQPSTFDHALSIMRRNCFIIEDDDEEDELNDYSWPLCKPLASDYSG